MRVAPADAGSASSSHKLLARTERGPQAVALLEETVAAIADIPPPGKPGQAYLAAGSLQQAAAPADEMKDRASPNGAGFYYSGVVAAREQRWDASQRDLDTALKLSPPAWMC